MWGKITFIYVCIYILNDLKTNISLKEESSIILQGSSEVTCNYFKYVPVAYFFTFIIN